MDSKITGDVLHGFISVPVPNAYFLKHNVLVATVY